MVRQAKVVEVWECGVCKFTQTSPIPASAMYCPKDHGRKSSKMTLTWSKENQGGDPPLTN